MKHSKRIKKITKKVFRGLSLRRDKYFIRNLSIGIGIIMIWVGVWGILEIYLTDFGVMGRVLCISVGILLLYLVDGGIDQLGGRGGTGDT